MPTLSVFRVSIEVDKMFTRSAAFHRRVQSTISVCTIGMFLFFVALLVLSILEPSRSHESEAAHFNIDATKLQITLPKKSWQPLRTSFESVVGSRRLDDKRRSGVQEDRVALEGMGSLFRKGRRHMTDLVVAHLSETTSPQDLRMFLRGLHRSGLPAKADVVLLFPRRPVLLEMADVIHKEDHYFQNLLTKYAEEQNQPDEKTLSTAVTPASPSEEPSNNVIQGSKLSVFNSAAYLRIPPVDSAQGHLETIWGRSGRNKSEVGSANVHDGLLGSYGAIVGFDMQELDPENTLSGFVDPPTAELRRWVCYQILLGMVRNRYRHVFLTEVKGVFILKDVLAPVKRKDNGLYLFYTGHKWADADLEDSSSLKPHSTEVEEGKLGHLDGVAVDSSRSFTGRRLFMQQESSTKKGIIQSVYGQQFWKTLEAEDKQRKLISTAVLMGAMRPVRSVTSAMVTEIVRVALLRKNRRAFRDEAVLNFLVHKSSSLGRKVGSHLQFHNSADSSINLLPASNHPTSDDFFRSNGGKFAVIQGLANLNVNPSRRNFIIQSLHDDICQPSHESQVYPDCSTNQKQ